jgi:hypothetical protein
MGDLQFAAYLRDLAEGPEPLVVIEDAGDLPHRRVTITADGRKVLAGQVDWLDRRPLDRWLGGVHLQGARPPWRWDRARQTLVSG